MIFYLVNDRYLCLKGGVTYRPALTIWHLDGKCYTFNAISVTFLSFHKVQWCANDIQYHPTWYPSTKYTLCHRLVHLDANR